MNPVILNQGQLNKAIPLQERALVIGEEKLGPAHPHTVEIKDQLAKSRQGPFYFSMVQAKHLDCEGQCVLRLRTHVQPFQPSQRAQRASGAYLVQTEATLRVWGHSLHCTFGSLIRRLEVIPAQRFSHSSSRTSPTTCRDVPAARQHSLLLC